MRRFVVNREENLDVVRQFAEAINARAVPEGLLTRDFRVDNVPTAVTDDTYHGAEGAQEWMRDLFEAFGDDARFTYEVLDVRPECVLARTRVRGRGHVSGAPLDLRWVAVLWVRDGRLSRAVGYRTRREALDALGRSE